MLIFAVVFVWSVPSNWTLVIPYFLSLLTTDYVALTFSYVYSFQLKTQNLEWQIQKDILNSFIPMLMITSWHLQQYILFGILFNAFMKIFLSSLQFSFPSRITLTALYGVNFNRTWKGKTISQWRHKKTEMSSGKRPEILTWDDLESDFYDWRC